MSEENFIPGIYHYCDRWCERCYFTSRCRSYAGNDRLLQEEQEPDNEQLWEDICGDFQDAFQLLFSIAEEDGMDVSAFTAAEIAERERKEKMIMQKIEAHPLLRLCDEYIEAVGGMLKKMYFLEKTKELEIHREMGIISHDQVFHEAASIKDCLEIIQWYLSTIRIKFIRALYARMGYENREAENSFQKDSNGSAKVALRAVVLSTEAWTRLLRFMSNQEDKILDLLVLLEKIKRAGKEEFPDAEKFIRPGFDEITL